MKDRFTKRFEELNKKIVQIEQTKQNIDGFDEVDQELFDSWYLNVKNLISNACGLSSAHYKGLIGDIPSYSMSRDSYDSSYEKFRRVKSVFLAAKEDYENGYIISVKDLVHAEVFNDQIEQAKELLSNGYYLPAAVVAGVVLETKLREVCVNRNLQTGKLDKMNADLAKEGLYNILVQKRITSIADLRNKAAHGKTDQFNTDDVKAMIGEIEHILSKIS